MPEPSPIKVFQTKRDWATWLEKSHAKSDGVWLRIAKKGAALRTVSYAEAVEAALCYGWIDGQKRPESAHAWLQRFLPRSNRSLWSRVNRQKALALTEAGQMRPAGLAAIERARQNGRWDTAYDPPSHARVPRDLQAALDASPAARQFFETLDRANRYAILWRVQTAKKADTRARKIEQFVAMLEAKEKIHNGL